MEPGTLAGIAPMTVTLALIAMAVLALAVLLRAARGQRAAIGSLAELEGRTQPVDLAAFRNLVDESEEEFLRSHLGAAEFRRIQRERLHASVEYVQRTAHNAAMLISLGDVVRRQGEPEVAEVARELVNSALRLRLNAFIALVTLYARLAFPEARLSPGQVIETYQALTERTLRLSRMQSPAYTARLSAII